MTVPITKSQPIVDRNGKLTDYGYKLLLELERRLAALEP